MSVNSDAILGELRRVEAQRARRDADPALASAVVALKAYQQERFGRTYPDLLASDRFRAAARFFLDELYGPGDFSSRDAQFARVVPALVRLFPREVVVTVLSLVRLHALTEELDSAMGDSLRGGPIDRHGYIRAWRATGRREDRQRQLTLTLGVGIELDRLTRKPLLRQTLHLMRGPARAAGLDRLQIFLESGFDAFRSMRGAQPFLDVIADREGLLIGALFDAAEEDDTSSAPFATSALGQLP